MKTKSILKNENKNKKGFTLLELILVMGIMGLVLMFFSPLITSFIHAQKRLQSQSQVDSRLNEVVDFIKYDVRNAKSIASLNNEPVGVYLDDTTLDIIDTEGTKVVINGIDSDGVNILIDYFLDGDELKIRTSDGTTTSTMLENVEKAEFKYQDKILLIYIKIKVADDMEGKIRNEIRDVAITRINQN